MKRERAVLYCRVSGDVADGDGVSMQVQEQKGRAYCELEHLEVVGCFSEQEDKRTSAFKPLGDRPEGGKMLSTIKSKKATHIIAYNQARLFRNSADAIVTAADWTKRGVTLHLLQCGGQAVNLGSAIGKLFWGMMSCYDQYHRDNTAELTQVALEMKKENGEAYSPTPFGKKRNGNTLERDAKQEKVIKRMARMRNDGKSLRAIAAALNKSKVKTKQGRVWHASTISYILKSRGIG